jgi:hypothetical protein
MLRQEMSRLTALGWLMVYNYNDAAPCVCHVALISRS